MKHRWKKSRRLLSYLGLSLLLMACPAEKSDKPQESPTLPPEIISGTLKAGHGLNNIQINATRYDEFKEKWGSYFREQRQEVSYSCNTPNCQHKEAVEISFFQENWLQLEFEAMTNPEFAYNLRLKRIIIDCYSECPFTGQTERGIQLGATKEQIQSAYGKADEQKQVTVQTSSGKKRVGPNDLLYHSGILFKRRKSGELYSIEIFAEND